MIINQMVQNIWGTVKQVKSWSNVLYLAEGYGQLELSRQYGTEKS